MYSIRKVQKRNGVIVDFDITKIKDAMSKAMASVSIDPDSRVDVLVNQVRCMVAKQCSGGVPNVEDIQDCVETVLMNNGYSDVAKSYILYRQKQNERRADIDVVVAVEKTINEYLEKLDWRVQANSNQGYSLGGLILNTSGKVIANYWLSHVYPKYVGDAHRSGSIHIHDLDMLSGYCAGWSLRALLEEGFNGVPNKVESHPPKHLSSAVAQMVNFLGTLQNEWAGAQAFSSFDTYLAPFVKKYKLEIEQELLETQARFLSEEEKKDFIQKRTFSYVYQNMQSLVFNLNVPSRWGTQTPFTNITLDWKCPDDLKDRRLLLGGKPFQYTYGELQEEMDLINLAFIKVMSQGDSNGRTFTFPIPTYNITKDFNWNDPKTLPLFEMTAKYGTPYFQNFINSDLDPGDVRSMCCRLQLDVRELRKRGGGLFGSSEMTGSIGVVTINLARIGYQYRDDMDGFYRQVGELMDIAKTSLEMKRREIQKWLDRGLFPFTKRYLPTLANHFSTIGVNGMNEAIRNFFSDTENITTQKGHEFAMKVLAFVRDRLGDYQEETGNLYNLEATPAEGTTYRFAKEDKMLFPEILQAGTEQAPYYTNSSQLPVGFTDDVFTALELQDELQAQYTGGTVLHCYMQERVSSPAACRDLVRKILSNFRLPYITITPTFSICPKHGYLSGEYDYCPKCDDELGYAGNDHLDLDLRKEHVATT